MLPCVPMSKQRLSRFGSKSLLRLQLSSPMIGRFKYLVSLADDADEASIKQYIGEIKEANYEEATCVETIPMISLLLHFAVRLCVPHRSAHGSPG